MVSTILFKAALPSIPVVNRLPGVRKTAGDPSSLHELRSVTMDADHVRAYARVCGFPVKDDVPLTFPHVLAFPLHMAVMASPDFPFPAIGTVHLANTITRHRALLVGEMLQVEVHTSPTRPHPKGTAIDFLSRASTGGQTVWESVSTYLRRGRPDTSAAASPATSDHAGDQTRDQTVDDIETVPGRVTWRLGGDVGRRYAAVSGDHNPIHLYALTARAFGYHRPIAHGMWTLARCVAALENRLPAAVSVDAAFTRPVLLPGTVGFGQDADDRGIAFALTSPTTGAPHLMGRTRAPA